MIYALDVEEETVREIVEKLGGEEVMPSLAERLIKRVKMEGKIEGKQTTLIKQLRRKFGLTHWEEEKIRSINDEAKLDAAAEAILDAESKSEVLKMLD
jgi:effector-binding domain-containing protein